MEQSGASKTYPVQANALKHGGYVVINGFPCKIIDISKSKTGKHGHAKVHIVGVDIFTGKKYEDVLPASHNVDVPIITREEYQLIDVNANNQGLAGGRPYVDQDDYYLTLLSEKGEQKTDLKLSGEDPLLTQIQDLQADDKIVMCTVLSALDKEAVVAVKGN